MARRMNRKGVVTDPCKRCGKSKPAVEMLSRRSAVCDDCDADNNWWRGTVMVCIGLVLLHMYALSLT